MERLGRVGIGSAVTEGFGRAIAFWLGSAVQVRTGKLCRVRVRPGWVGRGKAVQVRIVMECFGRVGIGSAVTDWSGATRSVLDRPGKAVQVRTGKL